MHAVYLVCLVGGSVATVLFAALGALGGVAGHGVAHPHMAHAPGAHAAHAAHTAPANASHANAIHAAHVPDAPAQGHNAVPAHSTTVGPTMGVPHRIAATANWTLTWLSPLTLAAAALWFGGAGLVAESALPRGLTIVVAVLAIVAAVLGAALVRGVMAALIRSSTPPLHSEAAGAIGTISAPIRPDAAGEVIYTLEGLRRSAAARNVDGTPLPRGTTVVILRREEGVAWVQALDPLATLERRD